MTRINGVFSDLKSVSIESINELNEKKEIILEFVNNRIKERKDLDKSLIGHNSIYTIFINNHKFFSYFTNGLQEGNLSKISESLCETYKSYRILGISYDLWLVMYEMTLVALKWYLNENTHDEIFPFFQRIVKNHKKFIEVSEVAEPNTERIMSNLTAIKEKTVENLINGNERDLVEASKIYITDIQSLKYFYVGIIQPSMHEIDQMRLDGKLSQEDELKANNELVKIMNYLFMYYKSLEQKQNTFRINSEKFGNFGHYYFC